MAGAPAQSGRRRRRHAWPRCLGTTADITQHTAVSCDSACAPWRAWPPPMLSRMRRPACCTTGCPLLQMCLWCTACVGAASSRRAACRARRGSTAGSQNSTRLTQQQAAHTAPTRTRAARSLTHGWATSSKSARPAQQQQLLLQQRLPVMRWVGWPAALQQRAAPGTHRAVCLIICVRTQPGDAGRAISSHTSSSRLVGVGCSSSGRRRKWAGAGPAGPHQQRGSRARSSSSRRCAGRQRRRRRRQQRRVCQPCVVVHTAEEVSESAGRAAGEARWRGTRGAHPSLACATRRALLLPARRRLTWTRCVSCHGAASPPSCGRSAGGCCSATCHQTSAAQDSSCC